MCRCPTIDAGPQDVEVRRRRREDDGHAVARAPLASLGGFALSLIGFGISMYLTIEHFQSVAADLFRHRASSTASKVTDEQLLPHLRDPGGAARAALLHRHGGRSTSLRCGGPGRRGWRWRRLALAASGICFVLYLLAAELFSIKAICLWCTGVHVTTFLLFVLVVVSFPLMSPPGRSGTGSGSRATTKPDRPGPPGATGPGPAGLRRV